MSDDQAETPAPTQLNTDNIKEVKVKKPKLTYKQKVFAAQYALLGNGTEAAVRAGYGNGNRQVAATIASENLTKLNVRQEVEKMSLKAAKRLDQIIEVGKEHNALQASMYVLDHQLGKATQKIEQTSNHLVVTLDLTGGEYGQAPELAPELDGPERSAVVIENKNNE